jgi:putative membrane-bound dehydrogenase-like protein
MKNNFKMRDFYRLVICALISSSFVYGCMSKKPASDSWPFTPEVEEFIKIYVNEGGEKLHSWVQEDKVPEPEESLQKFEVREDFEMKLIVNEPLINQPIDMDFDERGRLWVVQYKQYPFPAGITITSYDQYLRAEFNEVLSPPPHHIKGADKITVLEDTNGDGVFDSSKDVITGLNITTSILVNHGGIWVMSPPHLLFYPDIDEDGYPDGDPEVHLDGFGLEDVHAVANSLEMGPDGWIYGVQGSTTTAEVKGVRFLGQALWRYNPTTTAFELFSEGGGNLFTLDLDSKGRAFSGTNAGGARGDHWIQGGYFNKNFKKHGPFTTPYTYGSFDYMDHEGNQDRFSMTLTVYEEGKIPGYEGQMISGMAMTNRIQASRILADGSTFKTIDTDALVTTTDRSFRPVDIQVGPDGAVYIADWCDIRMDHVDPRDTWDPCGRIWRLQSTNYQEIAPFNLDDLTSEGLVGLLSDEREWYRAQARNLLGARKDHSVVKSLKKLAEDNTGQIALEALWATNLIEGLDQEWALQLLDHPNESVRYWTIRLLGDRGIITPELRKKMIGLAGDEPSAEVRSQLASTSRRLPTEDALGILNKLIHRTEDLDDKHIPLLIWWALEDKIEKDHKKVLTFLEDSVVWNAPIFIKYIAQRIGQRIAAERGDNPSYTRVDHYENWMEYASNPRKAMPNGKGDYSTWETNYTPEISDKSMGILNTLLHLAPDSSSVNLLLSGIEAGLSQGPAVEVVPKALNTTIDSLWNTLDHTQSLISVAGQLGSLEVQETAKGKIIANEEANMAQAELEGTDLGEQLFITNCSVCHQVDGSGMEGLAPPLQNSQRVRGPVDKLARIILQGFRGDIGLMPSMKAIEDKEVAEILTFVRGRWGNEGETVSSKTVEKIRAETKGRNHPWTEEELSNL